ncbi:MAG: hypothetical protein JWM09_316 [Francisellaceae bacterium]|nr:hypothetical protein [Francisellaceae bacterium]
MLNRLCCCKKREEYKNCQSTSNSSDIRSPLFEKAFDIKHYHSTSPCPTTIYTPPPSLPSSYPMPLWMEYTQEQKSPFEEKKEELQKKENIPSPDRIRSSPPINIPESEKKSKSNTPIKVSSPEGTSKEKLSSGLFAYGNTVLTYLKALNCQSGESVSEKFNNPTSESPDCIFRFSPTSFD